MADPLTKIQVDNLKPGAARREVPDGKVGGLYLIIQPSGARSWALRFRDAGMPRKLTLGPYPGLDLAAARRAAQRAIAEIAVGKDPIALKKKEKEVKRAEASAERHTVASVVDLFVERYAKPKNRSWAETDRLLKKEVVARWGKRPLASITRANVHELLDGIVDRPAPIIANRTLAAFRRVCNWSVERGIIDHSPCDKIKAPGAEHKRDRILTDDELRRVWNACDALGYPFGSIVRLLILTGQRREEVAQMEWREVDLDRKTWIIPKERAKNGVEHEVPLSRSAVDLLSRLPKFKSKEKDGAKSEKVSAFVFTTTGDTAPSGFSKVKKSLDDTIGKQRLKENPDAEPITPWVIHDFRRTVASGMARLGINLPIIEKVLNHMSGSFGGIVSVYQRHSFADEKGAALETWARHVEGLVSGKAKSNVVELSSARA